MYPIIQLPYVIINYTIRGFAGAQIMATLEGKFLMVAGANYSAI